MKIKKILIWDNEEEKSFYEDRFQNKINYIYSKTENNVGKTILMNAISLCLGGETQFPLGFEIEEHNVYLYFSISQKEIEVVCKEGSIYLVKFANKEYVFESKYEYSLFWNENVFRLPVLKNRYSKKYEIQYLEFIQELFYIYQDKQDTSKVNSTSQYNREQFTKMMLDLLDNKYIREIKSDEEQEEIKELRNRLKERNKIKKEIEKDKEFSIFLNKNYNKFELIEKEIEPFKEEEEKIKKEILKNQKKINDLKKIIPAKESKEKFYVCKGCGSSEFVIIYKTLKFDVFNKHQKEKLTSIINEDIEQYSKKINRLINEKEKIDLKIENLYGGDISQENFYKYKISKNEKEYKGYKIDEAKIYQLESEMKKVKELENEEKRKKGELERDILKIMNREKQKYKFDIKTPLYDKLFTTKNKILSGSTINNFLFLRVVAVNKILNEYKFPLILDGFRDNEISTKIEEDYFKILEDIENQVIVTATLKDEEITKFKNVNYILYEGQLLSNGNARKIVEVKNKFKYLN